MGAWSEVDSRHFLEVGRFYVPQRERQLAIIATLVPRLPQAAAVIDLCCGEGLLAEAILAAQPETTVLGLDGSLAMRETAQRHLAHFAQRFRTAGCDLHHLALPDHAPLRAIVSSLALHHVEHRAKPALYRQLRAALAPGGALLVADLVRPASAAGRELAATGWDAAVRAADAAAGAGGAAWQRFQRERWNWFRYPDEADRPAPIADELDWLRAAGLEAVDVCWSDCGHAVFGGFAPPTAPSSESSPLGSGEG
ncbi:MAG TPA: class I SAM-dependent methyltransferase [Thermoanaerobaculia bacterium]|nr:class I SAM-dependent methyltransferase [Thermoanaerobaculia bacterium]